MAEKAVD